MRTASRSRSPGSKSPRAQQGFERFKLYDVLPKERIFHSVDEAIRTLAKPS